MWAAVLLAGAVANAAPPGAESGVQSTLNEVEVSASLR